MMKGYSPVDTNAAQFARLGNPWVSERDRAEFSAPNRKQTRENRRTKTGEFPTFRDPPREGRELTPAEQLAEQQRKNFLHLSRMGKARRGQDVREVRGYEPKRVVERVLPKCNAELDAFHPERLAAESRKLEAAHRKAVADVQAAKLTAMQAALAKFDKKMGKALV